MAISGEILTLTREIAAIRVNHPDTPPGPLFRIPAHSGLRRICPSPTPGMTEVDWQGVRYAVFEQDLQIRTHADSDDSPSGFFSRLFA